MPVCAALMYSGTARWILLQLPGRSRVRTPPRLLKNEVLRISDWWFRRGLLSDVARHAALRWIYYTDSCTSACFPQCPETDREGLSVYSATLERASIYILCT